jgi:hypothetical protein
MDYRDLLLRYMAHVWYEAGNPLIDGPCPDCFTTAECNPTVAPLRGESAVREAGRGGLSAPGFAAAAAQVCFGGLSSLIQIPGERSSRPTPGGLSRPLRARAGAWARRHGHGVPRPRPAARPTRRSAGAASRARRDPRPRFLSEMRAVRRSLQGRSPSLTVRASARRRVRRAATGGRVQEVVVLNWLAEVRSRMDPRTTGRTRD